MQLKNKHESGTCKVSACEKVTAAVVDGKTFFSKRAGNIELCEPHLFTAQDMAVAMGNELVWEECVARVAPPPATAPKPPGQSKAVTKVKKELVKEMSEAEAALAQINEFQIVTKEDMEFAAGVLQETKANSKRIDAKRQEITKPLNAALRATNELFKPVIQYYLNCERILKLKIAAAHTEAEAKAKAALEAAGEAAAAGDNTAVTTALENHDAAVEFPTTDGIQYRSKWKYEITDEKLLTREYLMPNHAMIQGVVGNKKGATDIPGVRAYEDKVIASTAK